MRFTWNHIITLADRLWRLNQTEIGNRLGVDRSTISRLRSGKQRCLNRPYKDIYQRLFVPNLEGSSDQARPLNEMKQELERMGLSEIIEGLDSSSYESLAFGLIKLANARSSKDDAPPDDSTFTLSVRRKKDAKKSADSPPREPEPLYKSFASAVAGFPIEKFLDSDPAASLADYLLRDTITFWGRINAEREQRVATDGTTDTDQSIISFIDALKDYLGFLMANSERPDAFPDDFRFVGDDDEAADTANHCRENVRALFNAASVAVESEHEKVGRGRPNTIHAGEYSPPPALEEYREKFKAT